MVAAEMAMFHAEMKKKTGPKPKPDCANNVSKTEKEGRNTEHGNSKAYSVERVKKECEPEVVEAVMKGELPKRTSRRRLSMPFETQKEEPLAMQLRQRRKSRLPTLADRRKRNQEMLTM